MNYVLLGMLTAGAVIITAELLMECACWGRCLQMAEALLFLLGFTSVTTVYEIAKTGKKTKSDKVNSAVDVWKRHCEKGGL